MSNPAKQPRAGRDLPAATAIGVGLLVLVAVSLIWFNFGFVLLVVVALSLGVVEIYQALQRIGMHAAVVPIVVGTVLSSTAPYFAAMFLPTGSRPDTSPFLAAGISLAVLGITVLGSFLWRMRGGPEGFVQDTAASFFIICYVPLLGAFVPLMLMSSEGSKRILCYILCVVGSDVGGYFIGILIGRHPMAPVISPKKSWEGFAGSVGLAVVVGAVSVPLLLGAEWWVGAVLGAALSGAAVCGDLIESLIKRDIGIKDMSNFLPGHGGVMDRLDSLLGAAPVAWLVLTLLVPIS